jgi:hypothetical protein
MCQLEDWIFWEWCIKMMKSMDLTVGDALYLYTICSILPDSSGFLPYKESLFLWSCIEPPRHAWRRAAIQHNGISAEIPKRYRTIMPCLHHRVPCILGDINSLLNYSLLIKDFFWLALKILSCHGEFVDTLDSAKVYTLKFQTA